MISGRAAPLRRGETIDLTGRLLAAGLINGHHHSHENYHKGRDNLPLSCG
jgi:guanine deaminase